MRIAPVVTLSSLTALLALVACAPGPASVEVEWAETSSPIINGDACTEEEFPTAMAILVDATINFGGEPQDITTVMCTGTLIAPDTVLTAAHCVDPSGLTFGFGTVDRADYYVTFQSDLSALAEAQGQAVELPESAIPARAVIGNPDFDLDSMNAVDGPGDFKDVGLVFLDIAIESVTPELVLRADEAEALTAGAEVQIAGWGQQVPTDGPFTAPPPGTVGKKICGTSTLSELGEFEMQIGGDSSTTRKCHGDSGGPTYLNVNGERRVIGITSHAYDSSDCQKGGVDTRVDVWVPWIEAEMAGRCDDGSRAYCDEPGLPRDTDDEAPEPLDVDPVAELPIGCASFPLEASALAGLALLRRRRPVV